MQTEPGQIVISFSAPLSEPGDGDRSRVLVDLEAVRRERLSWGRGLVPSAVLYLAVGHGVPVVRYHEWERWRAILILRHDRAAGGRDASRAARGLVGLNSSRRPVRWLLGRG